MAWLDNGVTNARTVLDQAPAAGPWGTAPVTVNFNPINNVGYLKRLWLRIPFSQSSIQLAATGNTIAALAEKDWPVDRGLGSFSLIAQGIAPIYQLSKGAIDLKYLRYMGSGRQFGTQFPSPGVSEANAATNTMLQGHTSDQWQARQGLTIAAQSGAGPFVQVTQYAAMWDIPITEYVTFPGGVIPGPGGQPVNLPGMVSEVGLLAAQNTQVNFRTSAILNPFSVLTGGTYDTVTKATTAVPTTGFLSPTVQLWSEFYDVPTDPRNQPPPYSQQWVITRQTRDWPVSTTNVFPKFEPAGLLLRACYVFLDANDQIIDISGTQGDAGTISFKWGSSVYKFNAESFEFNLARSAEFYGDAPPSGCLIHDFFRDHTLTDVINTALLPSVSAEIKGLPAAVATCHVIEERMVPVQVG